MSLDPGRAFARTRPSRLTSATLTWYVQGCASITASRETSVRANGSGSGATR